MAALAGDTLQVLIDHSMEQQWSRFQALVKQEFARLPRLVAAELCMACEEITSSGGCVACQQFAAFDCRCKCSKGRAGDVGSDAGCFLNTMQGDGDRAAFPPPLGDKDGDPHGDFPTPRPVGSPVLACCSDCSEVDERAHGSDAIKVSIIEALLPASLEDEVAINATAMTPISSVKSSAKVESVSPPTSSIQATREISASARQRIGFYLQEIKDVVPEEGVQAWAAHKAQQPGICFEQFVASPIFTAISSFAIIANTIFMGADMNNKVSEELRRLSFDTLQVSSRTPEFAFTSFFSLELLMRIFAQKGFFIVGSDCWWNLFDVILIVSSVFELLMSTGGNLSVLRICRIFRLVRLMKVIRKVQLLQSLNSMVSGIINCIAPLFWTLCILLIVMYSFGVFFMSVIVSWLSELAPGSEVAIVDEIQAKYGSIYKMLCLLFEAISGGNDWAGLASELKYIGEPYYLFFAGYILFVTLGVLNIVTGFFVDGALQTSAETKEDLMMMELDAKSNTMQLIREMFVVLDKDSSGCLTMDELEPQLNNPEVCGYFGRLGIEISEVKKLFGLLDFRGTGEVATHVFVEGCLQCSRGPRSFDICSLYYQNERQNHDIREVLKMLREPRRNQEA
eukprot:NODE_2115_length_2289_cov_14.107308.p1 GENE.NODE_2115_length_2289_cov_14.107308~~NODE_2115_length_2289_cov_14.107308.p1  ORF type:complete len:623 (+),score=151.10 NODE_2115_length_2289_cov_14.107308:133-2001(+)